MALAVAIQMDPIDTINIDADSTFALALEAQARGHALFHYLPDALTLHDGRLYARARPLEVTRRQGNHHRFGAFEELDLAGVDVILMRQDPPFDMAYITATHLLELLPEDGPLVVNDPAAVRNAPEKLFVLRFQRADAADSADPRPRRDPRLLEGARRHHPEAAVRQWRRRGVPPAAGRREPDGAAGNVRVDPARAGHGAALRARRCARATSASSSSKAEPMGAVLRVPPEGEARANLHVGARPVKTELTAARPRDLRGDRTDLARSGAGLCRDRRDRRLADRDQRHLADRHSGDRAARRHRDRAEDLGRDRGAARRARQPHARPERNLRGTDT